MSGALGSTGSLTPAVPEALVTRDVIQRSLFTCYVVLRAAVLSPRALGGSPLLQGPSRPRIHSVVRSLTRALEEPAEMLLSPQIELVTCEHIQWWPTTVGGNSLDPKTKQTHVM